MDYVINHINHQFCKISIDENLVTRTDIHSKLDSFTSSYGSIYIRLHGDDITYQCSGVISNCNVSDVYFVTARFEYAGIYDSLLKSCTSKDSTFIDCDIKVSDFVGCTVIGGNADIMECQSTIILECDVKSIVFSENTYPIY